MKNSLLRFLLILFSFSLLTNAQKLPKPILFEWNLIQRDSSINVFLSFRISNDFLVFVKEGNIYKSGLTINYDLFDEENNLVNRVTDKQEIEVQDYSLTNSRDNYLQGITVFPLAEGKYKVVPTANLSFAERDYLLKEFFIEIPPIEKNIIGKPIIVESKIADCGNEKVFQLANFENNLPYSRNQFSIIIPIFDAGISNVTISIEQNKNTVFKKDFTSFENNELNIEKCSEYIAVNKISSEKNNYVLLENINLFIDEDEFKIKVNYGEENSEFELNSVWIKKPKSLRNVKEAVLILYEFFEEKMVDEVYSADSDSLYSALKKFWMGYVKIHDTKFNQVMSEFYTRVDYANDNYSSKNKLDGAKSDRGKVYIKFGEPSKNERHFENNKVVEIWNYEQLDKIFVFSDYTGTGNFVLEK